MRGRHFKIVKAVRLGWKRVRGCRIVQAHRVVCLGCGCPIRVNVRVRLVSKIVKGVGWA